MKGLKNGQGIKKTPAQSFVEFALVLPILLVLIISAIELGRLFYTKIVITNAAREGAYYLVTHITDKDATDATLKEGTEDAAKAEAANSGIPVIEGFPDITVEFSPETGWVPGDNIEVTVNTTVDNLLIIGFLGNILSITATNNSFDLSSSVEMMVQP